MQVAPSPLEPLPVAKPTFAPRRIAAPPRAPQPHRFGHKVFALIVILLAASLGWLYFHDEPPPVDTDLAVPGTTVADDKNGLVQLARLPEPALDFDAFAAARGVNPADADAILYGNQRNDALVDAYLAQVQPAFVQLDAILALPRFANPGAIYPLPNFPELAPTFNVAKALRLSVQRHLQLNDFQPAVQDTLRLRLLATRLTESYPFLIQYLLAHTIYDFSATCARDLLNAPGLPMAQQIIITAAYSDNTPTTAAFQRSLAVEYQYTIAELAAEESRAALFAPDTLNAGPLGYLKALWLHLTVKPNATRHQLADFYRAWRQALDGPYSAINTQALDGEHLRPSAHDSFLTRLADYSAPNSGGRYFYRQALPSAKILQEPYLEVADDRLLRTGFALRRYWQDHGILPPTLALLVPNYLSTIPAYPYEEQPLHYDPARGIVYSLGTALQDTHGSRFVTQPASTPGYLDPLLDPAQPTLVLTFQNK